MSGNGRAVRLVDEEEVIRRRFVQLGEMVQHCEERLGMLGAGAMVCFVVDRKAGRSGYIRLFGRYGGPIGKVVAAERGRTTGLFAASGVLEAAPSKLGAMVVEWPWLLEEDAG